MSQKTNPKAFYHKSLSCLDRGDLAAAASYVRQALSIQPNYAKAHHCLGVILGRLGQLQGAIASFQKTLEINPNFFKAYGDLGFTYLLLGKLEEARANLQKALAIEPSYLDARCNLGAVMLRQNKLEEAIACFHEVLATDPSHADAHCNLGAAFLEQDRPEEAIACYQKSLAIRPGDVKALSNLGVAFKQLDRLSEAIACYQEALKIAPNYAEAYCNLGVALKQQNKLQEAIAYFQQAIAIRPDFADARYNLSQALLLVGDYQRGFIEYEWRWRTKQLFFPAMFQNRYSRADLEGQTVVLWAEQGFGDAIQFIRYVPLVRQICRCVIVRCHASLQRLFSQVNGIDRSIDLEAELPDFDICVPLLSLPRIFATTLESIPATVPYLSGDRQAAIARQLGAENAGRDRLKSDSSLKVGIVWACGWKPQSVKSYQTRSCPLPLVMKHLAQANATLYSLQVGRDATDIQQFNYQDRVQDLSNEIHDFADTAALINQLDLVISVDTAVAHLAGAMGKPSWVLVPYNPDWRWMLEREDSPWYPTMRVFRQLQPGNWESALKQVQQAL